jgi:phosphoribosylaminoimidazolecarboxamide formyltransferase / IMP cyclohydrolase
MEKPAAATADAWRPIRRALISVSDKRGLAGLATTLAALDIELLSTGGTAQALRDLGYAVRDVAEVTQWPEMMDGRVKTLHPRIHGGLLAVRDAAGHQLAAAEHGIPMIDLLVVDLYPFERVRNSGGDFTTILENIDIGGPAMIRAAAKNHGDVAVIVDPDDYLALIAALQDAAAPGGTSAKFRLDLAARAFARVAAYDAAIAQWLSGVVGDPFGRHVSFAGVLSEKLRYGENPQQQAALYVNDTGAPGVVTARQIQGKALSYNNIADADAAFELLGDLPTDQAAVVIVKHANPCGAAMGQTLLEAYRHALACDPVSAFGGIVALNRRLDAELAGDILTLFTELVIAPSADDAAIAAFRAKPNVRLLLTGALPDQQRAVLQVRSVAGGLLVQTQDRAVVAAADLRVVTQKQPTAQEMADLLFAFRVVKHVKSNAIVLAHGLTTVGIGAGQPSRIDATAIAVNKAGVRATGAVVASDAFYPFADGVIAAAAAGVTAIIQPGGSLKDADVIAAADAAGLAMVLTGTRHFRH